MPGRSGTETKEQGKQMSHYRLNFDGDNPQLTVRKKPDLGFLIKNYQERHIGLNTEHTSARSNGIGVFTKFFTNAGSGPPR